MAKLQILKFQGLVTTMIILVSIFFIASQTSDTSCILDIKLSSSVNNSKNCRSGNWGGFINCNNGCCLPVFDEYLYALGEMANKTGHIFLNSTQQEDCLASMKHVYNGVLDCGIEKLTAGDGGGSGCYSYTKVDVVDELGNMLNNLAEDCKLIVNLDDENDRQACSGCLTRWEEIGGLSNDGGDLDSEANKLCRFAVLITLTSHLLDDRKTVQGIYNCLALHNNNNGFVGKEQAGTNGSVQQAGTSGSGHVRISKGKIILIIGLAGLAAIVVIAVSVMIFFRKRSRENLTTIQNGTYDSYSEESSDLNISPREIYLATDNLNEVNLIGQGIAGKVYRGKLSNGKDVAVKHILNDGYVETFVREVRSLSHIRHPNLVALLGSCEHKDGCFLVYELCHNGNLSEWLYGKNKILSWIQRLEIAIDSARGLWFLHSYPGGCIVHRDIKPTNILISAEFQAKLSDFGLSKVMDMGQSYVSSEVRGTFGYVDPEYRTNRHVNAKGDVYSFGIVLLQLISGQRVINLNFNRRPMQLNKMVKFLARGGNVMEFSDPKLNGDYSVEAFDLVLKLALSCIGIKQERPSMEQVVLRLEKALDISKVEQQL